MTIPTWHQLPAGFPPPRMGNPLANDLRWSSTLNQLLMFRSASKVLALALATRAWNLSLMRCITLALTLRLHVRRKPAWAQAVCGTKTSTSGALYKIITKLHPQHPILCYHLFFAPLFFEPQKSLPLGLFYWANICLWPNCWNRVYATNLLVQPCMPPDQLAMHNQPFFVSVQLV